MRTRGITAVAVGFLALAAAAQEAPAASRPRSAREVRSYAMGLELGRQLRNKLVDVDPDTASRGLVDALRGDPPLLTDEEVRAAISDLQADMKRRVAEARGMGGEDNRRAGAAFLLENGKKPGVVALPSGLQYRILKAGGGPRPTARDTVSCRFRGTLLGGVEFDGSSDRGPPVTFPVAGVIKGWSEALQLMPVGSRWQLFVPPELAYGDRGAGELIGPNATLVFEVELVSIVD